MKRRRLERTVSALKPVLIAGRNQSLSAVSYTHLDVYKRQVQASPCEWVCIRQPEAADNINMLLASLAPAKHSRVAKQEAEHE